jgi:hypothetical protein
MSLFFDMVPRGLEWIWLIITKSTPNDEEPKNLVCPRFFVNERNE